MKFRFLTVLTCANMCKQFGIGHDFIRNSTDWKWKVTSAFGLSGSPGVRQKIELPIFPGFDINVNWNAQYELPELYGYVTSSFAFVSIVLRLATTSAVKNLIFQIPIRECVCSSICLEPLPLFTDL